MYHISLARSTDVTAQIALENLFETANQFHELRRGLEFMQELTSSWFETLESDEQVEINLQGLNYHLKSVLADAERINSDLIFHIEQVEKLISG